MGYCYGTSTTENLTIITCEQQGATKLPMHPLYLQMPIKPKEMNGDDLYKLLATKDTVAIDNHREEDNREIVFDAKKHPVSWRATESYSALEKLLQDPFDYFMHYSLMPARRKSNCLSLMATWLMK